MNPLYKKPLVINFHGHFQSSWILTNWRMYIFRGLFAVCALVFVQVSFGQDVSSFNKISVTSPTASALQKFTDYPVNLNTGLVDISIPIYNINVNGINVPIDFKYHASGIKYDDESEGLGLGWTLNAGGMITQIIQGNSRDNPTATDNFFKNSGTIRPQPAYSGGDNSSLIWLDKGYGDSEYDIYNFTFPGHSGKFFYPGTSTPVISPLKNLKITRPGIESNYFDVVDESGITYKFGHYSTNSNGSSPDAFIVEQDRMFTRTKNLLLTEIISADKADTVRLFYSSRLTQFKTTIQDKVVLRDKPQYTPSSVSTFNVHETFPSSYLMSFDYAELLQITFRTGNIKFNYNGTTLTGIKIYNNTSSAPLKIINVLQSGFSDDHFKLDQVNFFDRGLGQSYSYKLAYTGTPPGHQNTGIDYWGYYNGAGYSGDYVPNFQVALDNNQGIPDVRSVGSMDRTPNQLFMQQSGMLQKITYPTGGSSVFNFEAHRYSGGQIAGGLRIQQIDNYDLNGNYLNSRWYKYGQNESGDGTIYKPIDPADYTYEVKQLYYKGCPYVFDDAGCGGTLPDWACRERTYGAFPLFTNTWGGGSPVVYDQVTEYSGDGVNGIANGKTIYNYENPIDYFSHMGVPAVTYSSSWKAGQLLSKQVFSKNGASYNLVSSVTNQYDDFNVSQYHNLKVVLTLDFVSNLNETDKWRDLEDYYTTRPLTDFRFSTIHNYADYYLLTGSRQLTSSTELRDGVSTTTSFTYDSTYLKPVTTVTTRSDGNNIVANFTYPFGLTAAPYPAMVANNIIEPVITKSEFKNDTSHPLESVTTNYGNWGNLYAPQSVSTQKGSDAAETRLIYDAYDDRGNILQRHRNAGLFEAYIWGYNKQYPIAEVKNAKANEVYLDNLEERTDFPDWGVSRDSVVVHSGKYSGRVDNSGSGEFVVHSNTTLQVSNSAPKKYHYSGWVFSTGPSIDLFLFMKRTGEGGYYSYVDNVSTAETGKWVYLSKDFLVPGDVTQLNLRVDNNGSSNGQVKSIWFDDLRICPSDAEMTTYTYEPLVGMTSATDSKGMTTTYEYDSFQRLLNVRDQNGNIVKHNDYHYQNQ